MTTKKATDILTWRPGDGLQPPWVEWIYDHERTTSVCDDGTAHLEASCPYGFLHGELWEDEDENVIEARVWLEVGS